MGNIDAGLLNLVELSTVAWLLFWAGYSTFRLAKYHLRSVYVVLIVTFLLLGLPLLWDFLFGVPSYFTLPGMAPANTDFASRLLYVLYLWMIPPIALIAANGGVNKTTSPDSYTARQAGHAIAKGAAWIAALSPFLAVLTSPSPRAYFVYGTVDHRYPHLAAGVSEYEFARHHVLVTSACLISTIAIAYLVYAHKGTLFTPLALSYLSILIFGVWVNGKRNAFAFSVFLIVMALWSRGTLKPKAVVTIGVSAVVALLMFSSWYQQDTRSADTWSSELAYNNTRLDYGRDHTARLAIYRLIHNDEKDILNYPGQSVIYYPLAMVPRSIWESKPPNYGMMVTSAALQDDNHFRGWILTTSWYDEAIANFGFAGFILGPGMLGLFCRVGDRKGPGILQMITMFAGALFVAVHLQAFMPVFGLWLVIVIQSKNQDRKRLTRDYQILPSGY